ncbi:hypothetical protein Aph02nite_45400 [Actinoplanes philippinensis]|uniref:Uncharacterized protein n=1 Tax=Actinoplanes philippinensis TaxID=35752 RepID=A0A1I2I924_9ACTN|nr:hypothetical protein [Actinoplanes philippinensis]GIE78590.1 hypothetical protein Aph02nite_45400 [Actinoplanes philippinensis]SFF37627.1 hypothetical protein SAMN05421541_109341 [Actinoplanes philippinensis]
MAGRGEERCRVHVRRYLEAPFLADQARRTQAANRADYENDVVTPGVPPSLRKALEEWVVDESTPDDEVADFIGWPVARVREHR